MATTVTTNPLNDFNSYSYHHFLILASSTGVATTLGDSETLFRFIQGTETIQGASVIVNPLISNRYIVQEAEWTSMLAANAVDYGSAVWSGGTLKIVEPRGMSFLNDLYDEVSALGTSIDNCVWILKTVFIGDTGVGSGAEKYQYINYVNPTIIMMTDLQIDFDETGSQYTFQFSLADSGAGAFKQYDGAAFNTDTTVNLAGGDKTGAVTLEQALTRLQDHANATYDKHYDKAQKTVEAQSGTEFDRMKYEIVIPDELKKPEYIVNCSKGQGAGADGSSATITVAPGTPLTGAIEEVITSCPNFVKASVTDGQKAIFQVTSSIVQNAPKAVPRKICRYTITVKQVPTIKDEVSQTKAISDAVSLGNYIEYDYMYTGKNIDVLDFQMHMNTGIMFFNTILSRTTMKDDRTQSVTSQWVTSSSNQRKMGAAGNTITFTPSALNSPGTGDKERPSDAEQFKQQMQQYTAVDNVMVGLKIRGNPRLLNGLSPSKQDIADGNAAITAAGGTNTDGGNLANYYATMPVYCKVNVKMPKDGDYSTIESFWYDGLYRVMTVKNVFSGGQFTQEMELITELDGVFKQVPEKTSATTSTATPTTVSGEPTEVEARIRAFMRMIRDGEGTASDTGYQTLFGGTTFPSYTDHPNTLITTKKYSSTAAGAYQILYKTWKGLQAAHGDLTDFTPAKQDMACYYLMQYRKALPFLRAGGDESNIRSAIAACKKEWASLPGSGYGQPESSFAKCWASYQTYYQQEMSSPIVTTLKIPSGTLS